MCDNNGVKHDGKENFMVSRSEANMVKGEFGENLGLIDDDDFSDKFLAIVSTLENTNIDHGTSDVQGETKCSEQSDSGYSNTLHTGLPTNSSYQDDPEVHDNNTTTQNCGQPSQPNQGQLGMGRSVAQISHVVQTSQRTDIKGMKTVGTILREETRYFCDEDHKILSLPVARMVVKKLRKKYNRLTEQHSEALQTTTQELGIYSYNIMQTGQSNLPSSGGKGSVTKPEAHNDGNVRSLKHSEDCEDNSNGFGIGDKENASNILEIGSGDGKKDEGLNLESQMEMRSKNVEHLEGIVNDVDGTEMKPDIDNLPRNEILADGELLEVNIGINLLEVNIGINTSELGDSQQDKSSSDSNILKSSKDGENLEAKSKNEKSLNEKQNVFSKNEDKEMFLNATMKEAASGQGKLSRGRYQSKREHNDDIDNPYDSSIGLSGLSKGKTMSQLGTRLEMDEATPQRKVSENGNDNTSVIGNISSQQTLNGNTYLQDNVDMDNGTYIYDQTNIQSICSDQNTDSETAMEKKSAKKDSGLEHGDRSGDYPIFDSHSNNMSFDVGKRDLELTKEQAVTMVSKINTRLEDTTLKVTSLFENNKLSTVQQSLLITVVDETSQQGEFFISELNSVQRNGVWNNAISVKLRMILEEYERSYVEETTVINGLQKETQTQHRKEILAGECMDKTDLISDQIKGYGKNASNKESAMVNENDNAKREHESMRGATDYKYLEDDKANVSEYGKDMQSENTSLCVQSEDMSLSVVSNPGSQLEINAEAALPTEQTEKMTTMDLDQKISEGYECHRENDAIVQLGIENG